MALVRTPPQRMSEKERSSWSAERSACPPFRCGSLLADDAPSYLSSVADARTQRNGPPFRGGLDKGAGPLFRALWLRAVACTSWGGDRWHHSRSSVRSAVASETHIAQRLRLTRTSPRAELRARCEQSAIEAPDVASAARAARQAHAAMAHDLSRLPVRMIQTTMPMHTSKKPKVAPALTTTSTSDVP
jgi:hypothetical protein